MFNLKGLVRNSIVGHVFFYNLRQETRVKLRCNKKTFSDDKLYGSFI